LKLNQWAILLRLLLRIKLIRHDGLVVPLMCRRSDEQLLLFLNVLLGQHVIIALIMVLSTGVALGWWGLLIL